MPPEAAASSPLSTLAAVTGRAATWGEFELCLQDYLLALRAVSTRAGIVATIADEPPFLAERFPDGMAADAVLMVCVRMIARLARIEVPRWAAVRGRAVPERATSDPEINLAVPLEIALGIRAGRPTVGIEHKRRTNAERQRRFRVRRAAEWRQLRRTVERESPSRARPAAKLSDLTLDLQALP